MRSRPHRLAGPLALAFALLAPALPVAADGIAPGFEHREYTYELANLDQFPDHLVVAYPVVCRGGQSYASEVTRRNRDMAHLLDYEVLASGRTHRPHRHCSDTRLYVIDAPGWKVEPIGSAPGRGNDELHLERVAELDALEVDGRDTFFRSDPRVHPTGLTLDDDTYVPEGGALQATHDVLLLERTGSKFRVRGDSVTYTYRDGTRQILGYKGRGRPRPSGKGALPPVARPPVALPVIAAPPQDVPQDSPFKHEEPATMPRPDLDEPAARLEPADPPDVAPAWQWPLAGGLLVIAALAAFRLRRRS